MNELTKKLKDAEWDHRVFRQGFLQSKHICNEVELARLELTKKISAQYQSVIWIKDRNLFDEASNEKFELLFKQAFTENKDWSLIKFEELKKISQQVDKLVKKLKEYKKTETIKLFSEYVELLKSIQKYYVIAAPLTNYCEKELTDHPELIKSYAFSYEPLEIDDFYNSKNPLEEFAWIKTAYNIVKELTPEEVKEEMSLESSSKPTTKIPADLKHLVDGMQIGIYLRNRMKELGQKLWYYIEPVAQDLAKELNITRDEFFHLRYQEVLESLEKNKLTVSKKEISERMKGYVIGFMEGEEILLTGSDAQELIDFFSQSKKEGDIVKGQVACLGKIKGTVRVILNKHDFPNLKQGEILVTRMTTPDFVVLMKKSAAIITDEGGLSCHAAIVSRELNIPCVIGTKNATQVLKDGDQVEVDAEKGIIKKIT